MTYRKIKPCALGAGWYVNVPADLRCVDPRKRRHFQSLKEAAEFAKQLTDARKTSLQFFFAMHPAALSELAYRIKELGYDRAIDALRRAKDAFAKSDQLACDVFAKFMADKSKAVRANTVSSVRSAIRELLDVRRPVAEISRDDVTDYIDGKGYEAAGRRFVLRSVKSFFRWCVDSGVLDKSPADSIKPPKVPRKEIKVLSVADCRALMMAAQGEPQLIPFLALQLFGGLRAAEAMRVRPDSIKNGHLVIVGDDTKLNVRRAIPISPQLQAWLDVPGCDYAPKDLFRKVARLKASIGLTPSKNELRHSFCSYLYALGTDIDFVAKAAGNSADILRKHYLGLASKEDGAEFAKILPV